MRGARRKPRAPASTVSGSTAATAISARRPDPGAVAEHTESLADQAAVLPDQRDHVGDRGEGDQVEIPVAGMATAADGLDRSLSS